MMALLTLLIIIFDASYSHRGDDDAHYVFGFKMKAAKVLEHFFPFFVVGYIPCIFFSSK